MNTKLQVLIEDKLKKAAEAAFESQGLNLSQGVRLLLNSFVQGDSKIVISNSTESINLSESAKKRYIQMMDDVKNKRNLVKEEDFDLLAE